jgi:ANTAR domain
VVDRGVAEPGRHTVGLPEQARGEVVIRRSPTGWKVEGSFPALPTDTVDELGHALTLADLLAEGTVPGPRPARPADGLDEVAQLRASVRQLEHALASRVTVEQAIGVLAERWHVAPRDAFEQLRRVTRSHGLRIHDLAKQVIESSTDPEAGLPAELAQPATAPPEPRQSPDARGRPAEPGERRRTRRAEAPVTGVRPADAPAPPSGPPAPSGPSGSAAPAPRVPHGRHARAER